eukprot:MONOS_7326.1-p1 / transcript=MONOS_7326.1 / gene=MONOS_7326 / organism=Monocercomonoides_exilis_PA203 / gene_product=unspecified product / transcript_product=unspecified product / location=Mono_scaffold00248:10953-11633(+) / protein_length=226 / sequence_SO=supercontig / SO=protein_coding / is_pseudo=false
MPEKTNFAIIGMDSYPTALRALQMIDKEMFGDTELEVTFANLAMLRSLKKEIPFQTSAQSTAFPKQPQAPAPRSRKKRSKKKLSGKTTPQSLDTYSTPGSKALRQSSTSPYPSSSSTSSQTTSSPLESSQTSSSIPHLNDYLTVAVRNISEDATPEMVDEAFGDYQVSQVTMPIMRGEGFVRNRGIAFVEFENMQEKLRALAELPFVVIDGRRCHVEPKKVKPTKR